MKTKGFSLIELMVVIAIVAVIAAVAVPQYQKYIIKSRIASVMPVLNELANSILIKHQTSGTWPNSVLFKGKTLVNDTFVNVSLGNLKYIRYDNYWHDAVRIIAVISGLEGIPGYVAPTDSAVNSNGNANVITILIADDKDPLRPVCGFMESVDDGYGIPSAYLPSYCKCSNLNHKFVGNGTYSCP